MKGSGGRHQVPVRGGHRLLDGLLLTCRVLVEDTGFLYEVDTDFWMVFSSHAGFW